MQLHRIKLEDKVARTHFSRWSLWLLVMSATVCAGIPQKREQASAQDNLSVQDSASITTDDVPVKAGEIFSFTVNLDRAPNFAGTTIGYHLQGPDPEGQGFNGNVAGVVGQKVYQIRVTIPLDFAGGTWTVKELYFGSGTKNHLIKFTPKTFQVIAKSGLIYPTSAEVVVNPSQQQLLRLEARFLQYRIQNLKAAIASYQEANQQGKIPQVLRTNVDAALKALQTTEVEFKSKATVQSQADIAGVFFGDLRLNYEDVLWNLEHSSTGLSRPAGFMNVAYRGKTPYAVIVQASLRAFEGNELAYNIVAESGSLTFNLTVTSNPSGAVVSYYRRGDPPHPYADPTTAVIPSLVYAVWYVRIEKPGYKPQVREHDPFHSSGHVVSVELSR